MALRGAKPNMPPQQGCFEDASPQNRRAVMQPDAQGPIDTTLDVDLRKLIKLKRNILPQLLALARASRLLGVGF
jgi:hypothetical protein